MYDTNEKHIKKKKKFIVRGRNFFWVAAILVVWLERGNIQKKILGLVSGIKRIDLSHVK
jgi:hypothetical protein